MPKKRAKVKAGRRTDFILRNTIIALIIILVVALMALTFKVEKCLNYECFQDNMIKCLPATYINEEPAASWHYEVIGLSKDNCEIEVTLLTAKRGELGLERLEDSSMTCLYPRGNSAYPDKDLSVCSGKLKEGLQEVIIEKLYKYIIDNLGEIQEGLREV